MNEVKESAGRTRNRVMEDRITTQNRAMDDRAVEQNRELSEDERVEMFRQSFHQSALPDLPKIPGWHLCWLTTTNPRDPIQSRIRLGYEPVKPEDIPGWEYATIKGGSFDGFIGVNEMLAFKIPESLYKRYMNEAHYEAPLREEQKLTDVAKFLKEQADRAGSRLDMGDGTAQLGQYRDPTLE
jgi:hypothetical protein